MAFVKKHLLTVYAIGVFLYLFVPVGLVILFGFNDITGRFNYRWIGFTFDHWESVFFGRTFGGVPGLWDSMLVSLRLAFLSSALGTALGTLIALALARYSFRGRSATNVFLFLPLATPEVVMGSAILAFFLVLGMSSGFTTLLISHTVFIVSYAVLTVKARIQGFDRHLEEVGIPVLYTNVFWGGRSEIKPSEILPGAYEAWCRSVGVEPAADGARPQAGRVACPDRA